MKLTFIIISYNEVEYLEAAIKSCLKQNVTDFEIIVGDDGSNDGSVELIEKFAHEYPDCIRYFVSDRNGLDIKNVIPSLRVSNIITRAMEMAKGEYCVVLSGDDYFYKSDFFEKAVRFLDNHSNYVAYVGGFEKVWKDSSLVVYNISYNPKLYWGSGKYIHISSFVFRKNIFDNGLFLQRFCDDTGLVYVLASTGKWKYDKEVVFAYRQREGSIMHTSKKFEFRLVELMMFQDVLGREGLYSQSLAHFSKSLRYVFKNRELLSEDRYKKYILNCEEYDCNILKAICEYDKNSGFKKIKFLIWMSYGRVLEICYRIVVRIYHLVLRATA